MARLKVYNADTEEWEYVNAPNSITVTDGDVTVDPTTTLRVGAGLTVLDNGDGEAEIGGSQPFTPTDLTDLALWLDASDAVTINAGSPSDDDPVSAWADKSAEGNDAAQATSDNRPVYKTAIQNGLGIVRFDPSGDNQFLDIPPGLFRNIDALTLFAAVGCSDFSSTGSFVYASQAGGDYCRLEFASSVDIDAADADADVTPAGGSAGLAGFLSLGVLADPGGSRMVAYLRTHPFGDNTVALAGSATPFANTDPQDANIGGTSPGHELTGDIGEVLIYQRALNTTEQRQVMEYLASKWATP